ncbi:XkdX family protein [Paenibacillus graminis]|nr:XkdX family protein [Paenibacillus graminis]MEC0169929.1 XkdX family protein [Paenibacillus graminis]
MDWYAVVKRHYDAGRYTVEQVEVFVTAKKITDKQAKEITTASAA